jgi:virginiamycin B lyase
MLFRGRQRCQPILEKLEDRWLLTFNEFPLPMRNSDAFFITLGPNGNLWFTEQAPGRIGQITTDGTVTEFALPNRSSRPTAITAGTRV